MKILLVEDDDALIAALTRSLTAQHYIVDAVKDGEKGWLYGSTFEYDLAILDLMLPKLDGIRLCQRFRSEGYTLPILLLTSQDSSTAKVQGLDAGADDFVVKPFDAAELIARIRALVRRGSANPLPLLTWGDLHLNPSTCEVTYGGQPLTLTTKEYDLLELLMRQTHHVFSSDEILDRLWSSEAFPAESTVRSHVRRLRQKLLAVGAPSDFISTLHGRGYYLKLPDQPDHAPLTGTSIARLPQRIAPETVLPIATERASEHATEHAIEQLNDQSLHLEPHPTPHPAGYLNDREPSKADQQAQYLAFLNTTWLNNQPRCLEQATLLLDKAQQLQSQVAMPLEPATASHSIAALSDLPNDQQEVHFAAHKLAGTLSIFGLTQAMRMARYLEERFKCPTLTIADLQEMSALAAQLQSMIQEIHHIEAVQLQEHLSQWLMINPETDWDAALTLAAHHQGVDLELVPSLDAAQTWLDRASAANSLPKLILLRLNALPTTAILTFLQTCAHRSPRLPVLLLGECDAWRDRLEILRCGGRWLPEPTLTPEQIFASATRFLGDTLTDTKVMIVDDDQAWLQTLPQLLRPWGFCATTLAEPEQFWPVLQTVNPDVLILDVNLPQINGLELCQILRSDPRWRRLPILFLSILSDPATQNQAFTAGADDYLCKPVRGKDLATRILNRLQRMRDQAS